MNGTNADDLARCAGNHHHHTPALKFTYRFPGTEELTGQFDVDHHVPLRQCHVFKGPILLQSCVIDQNVDRTKLLEHVLKHGLNLIFLGNFRLVYVGLTLHSV